MQETLTNGFLSCLYFAANVFANLRLIKGHIMLFILKKFVANFFHLIVFMCSYFRYHKSKIMTNKQQEELEVVVLKND